MKLLGPYRIWAILSVLALVMLLTAGVASATNKWNGYHWPSDKLSPTVVDNTGEPISNTGEAIFDVNDEVSEWADLGTLIQPTSGTSGDVEVVVTRMRPHYLGVARIWVDEFDHIGKGRVELNKRYLNSLTSDEWDHVLCQELGHIWAMAHSVGDDPSCMRGSDVLGLYTSPSGVHDKDTLNDIYVGHTDTSPPDDGGGSGGGDCDRNPAWKCRGSSNSSSGRWVTIHEFPAP